LSPDQETTKFVVAFNDIAIVFFRHVTWCSSPNRETISRL